MAVSALPSQISVENTLFYGCQNVIDEMGLNRWLYYFANNFLGFLDTLFFEISVCGPADSLCNGHGGTCIDGVAKSRDPADEELRNCTANVTSWKCKQYAFGMSFCNFTAILMANGYHHCCLQCCKGGHISPWKLGETSPNATCGHGCCMNNCVNFFLLSVAMLTLQ